MTDEQDLAQVMPPGVVPPDTARARLREFETLVRKWNPTINIVAKSTLAGLWERHTLDSAQIFRLLPRGATSWLDLGSGGGFPGIVIAILADSLAPALRVTLVESDRRKSVFLSQACRQLGLNVSVLNQRIEDLPPRSCDVVSARALAAMTTLCQFAHTHLSPSGTAIFLKGGRFKDEVDAARSAWSFNLDAVQSLTDADAKILVLTELRHA